MKKISRSKNGEKNKRFSSSRRNAFSAILALGVVALIGRSIPKPWYSTQTLFPMLHKIGGLEKDGLLILDGWVLSEKDLK